jgi:formylglycine-generating enzyme required for sulfatase activity
VVWVKAREAAEVCSIMGRRLCDAHEWEGACAGSLQPPDYRFDLARGLSPAAAVERMRAAYNQTHGPGKSWSYGPTYQKGVCATSSQKSPECDGGGWTKCGSNTFPAGTFPACHSPLDVYDLNGNAAEHMNLPLSESQMASRGSTELGYTEMKGSWFIFDTYRAHEDWCRWRAPYWHGSRVMDEHSHSNYHLGFRCCKSLE